MEATAKASGPDALTRRSWVSWFLGTSLGATLFAFLYPVLNYLVPPEASEPSLSEFELDFKASDVAPASTTTRRLSFTGANRRGAPG